MKSTITITATAEVTDNYRLAQSNHNMKRENLKPAFKGRAGEVFKRGVALDVDRCIMETPIDGWTPNPNHTTLGRLAHANIQDRVNKEFSNKGLAGFIATTDTTAGVREVIEYDENEQIVKPLIEGTNDD